MLALRQATRSLLGPTYRRFRSGGVLLRNTLGLTQSEAALVCDAQRYWNQTRHARYHSNSHWQSGELFAGGDAWSELGAQHLAIYDAFARALALSLPPARIVEWGCGGGANAVHFAPRAETFVGVDVSQASLDECGRQIAAAQAGTFQPVLIQTDRPEGALRQIDGGCDLFLCTYVFEALPTPEYGLRLLTIARDLLTDEGVAMIQIKYRTAAWGTASRRWNYARNLASNTTYAIDEFWLAAEDRGLKPRMMTLMPWQPLVNDGRYAYVALQKGGASAW